MNLIPLERHHFEALYLIELRSFPIPINVGFDAWCSKMQEMEGWVLCTDDGKVHGYIGFDQYRPRIVVTLHVVTDDFARGRWLNRKTLRAISNKAFKELKVEKLRGYSFPGYSDDAAKALARAGFELEGYFKREVLFDDTLYDVAFFALMKENDRWG